MAEKSLNLSEEARWVLESPNRYERRFYLPERTLIVEALPDRFSSGRPRITLKTLDPVYTQPAIMPYMLDVERHLVQGWTWLKGEQDYYDTEGLLIGDDNPSDWKTV